jgi:hypothetical protein
MATVIPAASAGRVPAQNTDSQQSWFLRLTKVLVKSFSRQPEQSSAQQNGISAYSSELPQNTVADSSIRRNESHFAEASDDQQNSESRAVAN